VAPTKLHAAWARGANAQPLVQSAAFIRLEVAEADQRSVAGSIRVAIASSVTGTSS
jgi:hypothetical protein